MKFTNKLLTALSFSLVSLTALAQTDSRLIAEHYFVSDGSYFRSVDTISYTYSSSRGGDLNSRYLPYDQATTLQYDAGWGIYRNTSKTLQSFNFRDHRTNKLQYSWDNGISAWVENLNLSYFPNADDSILTETRQSWNRGSGSWDNVTKKEQNFDGAKRKTDQSIYIWESATMTWAGEEKIMYTFDGTGKLEKRTYQNWESSTGNWQNQHQDSFLYSSSGKPTEDITQTWNTSTLSWDNFKKIVYSYDASDYLIEQLALSWNGSSWENVQQYTYTNDSKGNITSFRVNNWDGFSVTWYSFRKKEYTYDASDNIVNEYWSDWETGSSSYVNSDQISYTYAPGKLLTQYKTSIWNPVSNQWDSLQRISYSYNSRKQLTQKLYEKWNKLVMDWMHTPEDQMIRYYYQIYSTSIAEKPSLNAQINLFPVPACDFITIRMENKTSGPVNIRIIDFSGRTIKSWQSTTSVQYQQTIPLNQFSPGQYAVIFTDHSGKQSEQVFTILR